MTITFIEPATTATSRDDDLDHLFCCCSPEVALCGAALDEVDQCEDDEEQEHPCVVCADLVAVQCARCGYGIDGPCWCGRCEDGAA